MSYSSKKIIQLYIIVVSLVYATHLEPLASTIDHGPQSMTDTKKQTQDHQR
jgi:hypothetical protein